MCHQPERLDYDLNELKAIVTRAPLTDSEREKLNAALDTLAMLTLRDPLIFLGRSGNFRRDELLSAA